MADEVLARKRLILLGSTGSIGTSTLSVVDNLPDEIQIVALSAGAKWELLLSQIDRYRPRAVALTSPESASALERELNAKGNNRPAVYVGPTGLVEMVKEVDADVVVVAISGFAGLPASVAALQTKKNLALANKESMVCAGPLLNRLAREHNRTLLPVDSEHSAIFQCLHSGRSDEIREVILTASGGPFRSATRKELSRVSVADALKHPTWKMGEKITIDSATLMNKALEIIEARWLFDLPPEKIRVVIHPQSLIHSLVEFNDGSTICQLGPPDMRIPIQYALTYPHRRHLPTQRLDLAELGKLTFERPDPVRFPSLRMAYEVLVLGGTSATVFNAANEIAVELFLRKRIGFLRIFEVVDRALKSHVVVSDPSLEAIFEADRWARKEVLRAFK